MNRNLNRTSHRFSILRLLGTVLAFALLIYLGYQQGWDEILEAIQQVSVKDLITAFVFVILSRFAVTARWYSLLHAADESVSWLDSLRLTFAGLFSSNFLPTTIGGDVVRLAGAIQMQLDGATSAASLIVDRLIGMAGMALALPFSVVPVFTWWQGQGMSDRYLGLAGFAPFTWLAKVWRERMYPLLSRIKNALLIWWHNPKALFLSLLFTLLHMICLFAALDVLIRAVGDSLPYPQIGGLWSLVYFVTLLPVSINGYGLQEVSVSFVYANLGGISLRGSIVIAVLIRTLVMIASLPGAVFLPSILAGDKKDDEVKQG